MLQDDWTPIRELTAKMTWLPVTPVHSDSGGSVTFKRITRDVNDSAMEQAATEERRGLDTAARDSSSLLSKRDLPRVWNITSKAYDSAIPPDLRPTHNVEWYDAGRVVPEAEFYMAMITVACKYAVMDFE